jgi:site-specific recombinase
MAQALFANHREANLHSTVALIDEVLASLGGATRLPDAPPALHAWTIAKGSATARVQLLARPDYTHLRVSAAVVTLDARVDRAALFAHLLEHNRDLTGAAFALDGDIVLLVAERSTLDLDKSEVTELIRRVTTYADDHDDALVARFGGTLGGAT